MERTDFEQWKAKEVARLLALVETERRYYQEMVASLPVALVVLSADRSVVSANRAFRQTFGVRMEDLRRKTIEQILPSEELVEKIREAHLAQAPSAPRPFFFLRIGGKTLRLAIVPIRNWDDETEVETLLMAEETSALAEAPAAESVVEIASEQAAPEVPEIAPIPAAREIADMPAIVWKADPQALAFRSVSGAAEGLLGFPASHWMETEHFFSDRIHPEDRAATMAFYESMLGRAGDASAEFRAVTAAGGAVWVRETIRVPAAGEADRTITGVITDISRRKQLEGQLLTARRYTALHGVASRLAHDLNNPLMIISGYGEELLQSLAPENPMRGDIEQILSASDRISGVTEQLLGFTRKLADEPQSVNLTGLLSDLEESIHAAAGQGVAVEMALGEPVWTMAAPEQLEEAILALVSGAREGAQERSRVTIGCGTETIAEKLAESTLQPGTYARIAIHDNGKGMDSSRRAAIFEAVLTAKESEAQGAAALARSYSTIREWGGDIAFSSEPFHGSTFLIYLPYFQPEPVEEKPPAVNVPVQIAEPVAEAAPATLGSILLVEDEAGIRALVRKILRRERYEVLEAGTAEEGLNVAAAYGAPIDLLVTDVMLPGMGGRQLAESMLEWMPNMKVLYVSGYSDDEAVRTGSFPPGSKFLQKPFTLSSLVGRVREAMAD